MIKKLFGLFSCLLIFQTAFAQGPATGSKIPPFQIKLTNGQQFSASQLAKGPVVLIYFSPDCEHCQNFTKDLVKNYSVVANKQVVMVTFQDMAMLKPFVVKYGLNPLLNFKVGTEGTSYLVRNFYQVRWFPYIAIYDKDGRLVKTYEGTISHEEIFNALKAI